MAHFQLPSERGPYSTMLGGTRPFLSGNSGPEAVLIELGKTVTLQVGGAGNSTPAITQFVLPTSATDFISRLAAMLSSGPPAGPDVVSISSFGSRVTLKAIQQGTCALIIGGQIGLVVQVGKFQ